MKPPIELNFSHQFDGTIWNTALSGSRDVMVLEVRDGGRRKTSFSAINLNSGSLLWENVLFEEPWWVGLDGVNDDVALISVFTETSNPDRKALIAYHITDLKILWWHNDFSLSSMGLDCVAGVSMRYGHRDLALDLMTGTETGFVPHPSEVTTVRRPSQFVEGHPYFATVRTFLLGRFNLAAVASLEYLEASSLIFISCYTQGEDGLTNELLVLSTEGDLMLRENLGERLKGIGQDTFFIYRGSVIFVRNRGELFSYKIV